MKVFAINGSHRKRRTIDTFINKAFEAVKKRAPAVETEQIHLIDKDIKYCTNCMGCMVCRNDDSDNLIKDQIECSFDAKFATNIYAGAV